MTGFTRWRRSCPFTAGVLTTLAGAELIAVIATSTGVLRFSGTGATAGWVLGALLVVAGLTLLCQPVLRHFAGAVALVCGLLSLVQTNLGGFLLGFLLAATGGVLALAWVPVHDASPRGGEPANP
ncbi:DUF6114 domain-containing protein [Saccharothrix syringae]|uniref:Uncharacterized protein n=1 Tax=Saccharothrix syringae TaxID=103733 RepID=A0A5Q0GWQ2_SACSY|nr:DUF6114 domain-containing protein [Saccharothrix syringae]QFZ18409.1 hypothetical protein EKG83_13770 [Saccharothrix syringae]